jgi:hypothetical protein
MRFVTLAVASIFAAAVFAEEKNEPAKENAGLPLVFHENFANGEAAMKRFIFASPEAWKIDNDTVDGKEQNVLSQHKSVTVKTPVRSPFNQSWINDLVLSDFVMEVKLRSTKADYGHRDMCLFFAGVDASHMFYVHLGKTPDPHCHNIFLVDGKDRVAVATKINEGTPWDDKYHTVKLTRDAKGINVYWDGQLFMTSDRKELPAGKLGVGSFDDTGNFAEITIWGKKVN